MLARRTWPLLAGAGSGGAADDGGEYYDRVAFQIDATGLADAATIEDLSRHGHALTVNGGMQITSEHFEFDGTDDYITTTSHDGIFGAGYACTWEFFGVETDDDIGATVHFISQFSDDSGWRLYAENNSGPDRIVFDVGGAGASAPRASISQSTPFDIMAAWDGTTLRLYKDGVYQSSYAMSAEDVGEYQEELTIGRDDGAVGRWFDGRLKAMRLTKGVAKRTDTGTEAVPSLPLTTTSTATYTDSDFTDTVLCIVDGYDRSLNSFPLYAGTGASRSTASTKWGGTSLRVGSSGGGWFIRDSEKFHLSGDFTIEGWFAADDWTPSHPYIMLSQFGDTSRSWRLILNTSGSMTFDGSSDGSSFPTLLTADMSGETNGSFVHIAITRSGNDFKLYVDGSEVDSTTNSISFYQSNCGLLIGNQMRSPTTLSFNTSGYTEGYVDGLRITQGVARTITVPTAAFPYE